MHLNTKLKNWGICNEIQAVISRVKNSKVDFTQTYIIHANIVPKLIFKVIILSKFYTEYSSHIRQAVFLKIKI